MGAGKRERKKTERKDSRNRPAKMENMHGSHEIFAELSENSKDFSVFGPLQVKYSKTPEKNCAGFQILPACVNRIQSRPDGSDRRTKTDGRKPAFRIQTKNRKTTGRTQKEYPVEWISDKNPAAAGF